jgi:hypothetical protein
MLAWVGLAVGHALSSRFAEALDACRNAERAAAQHGGKPVVGIVKMIRGWIEIGLGEFEDAGESLRQAIAMCRACGSLRGESWARFYLAALYLERGLWREALIDFGTTSRLTFDTGDLFFETLAHSRSAVCHAQLGQREQAERALERARRTDERLNGSLLDVVIEADGLWLQICGGDAEGAEAAWSALKERIAAAGIERYEPFAYSRRLLARRIGSPLANANLVIVAAPEFRRLRLPDGALVDLAGHKAGQRILVHLANKSEPASLAELFAAGWPDQRIDQDAAAKRVITGIYRLRRQGLEGYLVRCKGGGYRLLPRIVISRQELGAESRRDSL